MASPPQASSIQQRQSLPIFQARKNLVRAFHEHKTTVVIGETASGKTTQIPQVIKMINYLVWPTVNQNGVAFKSGRK